MYLRVYFSLTVLIVRPENAPEVELLSTVLISKARRCNVPEVEAILGKPDHRVIEFTQAHPPTQQTANNK
jgi:hypothetical protein